MQDIETPVVTTSRKHIRFETTWTNGFRALVLLALAGIYWGATEGPKKVVEMVTPQINASVSNSLPTLVEQCSLQAAKNIEPVIDRRLSELTTKLSDKMRQDFVDARLYEARHEALRQQLSREESERKAEDLKVSDSLREIRAAQTETQRTLLDVARQVGASNGKKKE